MEFDVWIPGLESHILFSRSWKVLEFDPDKYVCNCALIGPIFICYFSWDMEINPSQVLINKVHKACGNIFSDKLWCLYRWFTCLVSR